jgi:hypothetical protein
MSIHRRLSRNYRSRNSLKRLKNIYQDSDAGYIFKIDTYLSLTNNRIKKLKELLYLLFSTNKSMRQLRPDSLKAKQVISVFDSILTRTLKIKANTFYDDIIIVQTYFFDILEDLICNSFNYKGEKYICFTASAGQIRTKKTVFIKEKVFLKHQNSLMCGLSIEKINSDGGVNINKYLAYLALCNSATEEWKGFDIEKSIVVENMKTSINTLVDFIDDNTYEINRTEMDLPIEHTDGCGMILPRTNKNSMMVRLPWVKGLLVPFPFDKFIREENRIEGSSKYGVVTDIYGKEHNLIKDKIEVIFTKSQFKMWKYYSSWE